MYLKIVPLSPQFRPLLIAVYVVQGASKVRSHQLYQILAPRQDIHCLLATPHLIRTKPNNVGDISGGFNSAGRGRIMQENIMVLLTPNCSNTTSTEIMEEHSLCIKITNSVLCLTNSIYFCFTHWNTYYHIIHKLYRLEIG